MKRKICALLMIIAMVVSMAACGGDGEKEQGAAYVYVPEYISLPTEENDNINVMQLRGSKLYYSVYSWDEETYESSQNYFSLDLLAENATPEEITANIAEGSDLMHLCFDAEGNLYMAVRGYEEIEQSDGEGNTYTGYDYEHPKFELIKCGADGSEIYRQDITKLIMPDEMSYGYVQYMQVDKTGNAYLSNGEDTIWVFDTNGNQLFTVPVSGWINGMGLSKDGDVYVAMYGASSMVLKKVDLQTKGFGPELTGVPDNFYGDIVPGIEKDFLLKSDTVLYEYDMETKTSTEVLRFIDCDMNGSYVEKIGASEDGKILVYYRDWNLNEEEIVKLTKTDASLVQEKQVLTLGGFYVDQDLQSAIVKFNKSNELYRITVRDYSESMTDNTTGAQDGYTLMYNDILTGNAPDMIMLEGINMENLAARGYIEDLTPYLEQSDKLKREDLIESVLRAYTCSDVLCSIPTSFSIATLMSASSIVGEEMGWSLDEMLAIADTLPENAQIMQYATKGTILQYMLLFGSGNYVNWETGECSFESEEFIKVLEFANSFDAEYNYNEDAPVMPELVENGELLLVDQGISALSDYQIIETIWGEPVTCIGFPSAGGNGAVMHGMGAVAISSQSEYKDAAWDFLEGYIVDSNAPESNLWSFPVMEEALEAMFEQDMTPNYEKNWETGELILDENGNPIEYSTHSWSYGNGVDYEIFAATQEQADKVRELIDTTTTVYSMDTELFNICLEEAEPYFAGQKSAAEVAKIIQGRIQVYVDESR